MKTQLNRSLWIGAAVLAVAFVGACASSNRAGGDAPQSRGPRIGTYDSRAVAIAYGRSETLAAKIEELIATRKRAVAEGDTRLAAETEAAGQAQQVRLHLQAFSNAPVGDAMATVQDRLAGVAERAGVCAIVSATDYLATGVEAVDVTDEIVALFGPDAPTLTIIRDCRRQEPLPIEVVAKLPANE